MTVPALLFAIVAMPAPPPAHAPTWPVLVFQEIRCADGMEHLVRCWRDGAGWHWREVDQPTHPIHLETPPEGWQIYGGQCYPDLCRPLPPGAMPGDRRVRPEPPEPPAIFQGPPE